MEYADECNRTAGFNSTPETTWRGRMKFLRQYEKQKGLCAICREWFAPAEMTRDHVTPRSKKGGTQWDNIQLTCEPCNHRKGDSLTAFAVVALRKIEEYSTIKTPMLNPDEILSQANRYYRELADKDIQSRAMRCICLAIVEAVNKELQRVESRQDSLRQIGSIEP